MPGRFVFLPYPRRHIGIVEIFTMKTYWVERGNWLKFVEAIKGKHEEIYGITSQLDKLSLGRISAAEDTVWGQIRAHQPLKSILFPPSEVVANYPQEKDIVKGLKRKILILGVKGCDLAALRIYDRVFLEEEKDPFYARRRTNTTIISSDCTTAGESCFCVYMNGKPYPGGDFDINVAPVGDGFVIEIGSSKGENLLQENLPGKPQEVSEGKLSERDQRRETVVKEVEGKNRDFSLEFPYAKRVRKNYQSEVWAQQTETCVGCGGCTAICPTCYCFLLRDEGEKANFSKVKLWDYCQYSSFARVAGGANPRAQLVERFRHRYLHKLDYAPLRSQEHECTGCGRCIDTCAGEIDMREVLTKLES